MESSCSISSSSICVSSISCPTQKHTPSEQKAWPGTRSTYVDVLLSAVLLLGVQLLRSGLVRGVLQVGPEQAQVLLLLGGVLLLCTVEGRLRGVDLLLDHDRVAHAQVVIKRAGHLGAEALQALRRRAQHTDLCDLEALRLLLHVLEEDGEVLGDLVVADEVLHVVARVKLLAQLLAHGLDVHDRLGEPHVRLVRVLEPDRAQHLELLFGALFVKLLLLLLDLYGLARLHLRDAVQFLQLLLEAAEVHRVVPDRPDRLHQGFPHAQAHRRLRALRRADALQGQPVV